MVTPTLPPELERAIFEICALSHPPSTATLMLVAWRVNLWVEPLLYRTLALSQYVMKIVQGHHTLENETIIRLLSSRPTSFFENSVRNLLMRDMKEDLEEAILRACSKIQNFWIVSDCTGDHYPLIGNLPLKRLHCSIEDLFFSTQPDFTLPLFSQITHLELIDYPEVIDVKMWSGIAFIPNLTHLYFSSIGFIRLWFSLLDTCKSLRVLVWLSPNGEFVADDQDGEALARDTRFVVMRCGEYVKDWQTGAYTGSDYWTRAEDFIAKRRSGEIDVLQYAIEEDASETIP
ncbi:hypothetical protein DFH09DRAFT_1369819 [Mycena vulgaris]|nr:hypothetical protein DFH09DRAFT_1369819 [Mycena vulgaris]